MKPSQTIVTSSDWLALRDIYKKVMAVVQNLATVDNPVLFDEFKDLEVALPRFNALLERWDRELTDSSYN